VFKEIIQENSKMNKELNLLAERIHQVPNKIYKSCSSYTYIGSKLYIKY
jgi:hypothetical protein